MSKNRNRKRLDKSESNSQYRKNFLKMKYPPYWDDDYNWIDGRPRYKKRSYKSWKHNRKKQYKNEI